MTQMRNVKLYMVLQWLFFLPLILPVCLIFGAIQGAIQMTERIINQFLTDVSASKPSSFTYQQEESLL